SRAARACWWRAGLSILLIGFSLGCKISLGDGEAKRVQRHHPGCQLGASLAPASVPNRGAQGAIFTTTPWVNATTTANATMATALQNKIRTVSLIRASRPSGGR